MLAFGDSVTFGTGAEPGEDWPTRLAALIRTGRWSMRAFPAIRPGSGHKPDSVAARRASAVARHHRAGGNDFQSATGVGGEGGFAPHR